MNDPNVSIIVRTKNEERWIGHCLKKIHSQVYKNYEVVLVDKPLLPTAVLFAPVVFACKAP